MRATTKQLTLELCVEEDGNCVYISISCPANDNMTEKFELRKTVGVGKALSMDNRIIATDVLPGVLEKAINDIFYGITAKTTALIEDAKDSFKEIRNKVI